VRSPPRRYELEVLEVKAPLVIGTVETTLTGLE
jgi:hypothetical protein